MAEIKCNPAAQLLQHFTTKYLVENENGTKLELVGMTDMLNWIDIKEKNGCVVLMKDGIHVAKKKLAQQDKYHGWMLPSKPVVGKVSMGTGPWVLTMPDGVDLLFVTDAGMWAFIDKQSKEDVAHLHKIGPMHYEINYADLIVNPLNAPIIGASSPMDEKVKSDGTYEYFQSFAVLVCEHPTAVFESVPPETFIEGPLSEVQLAAKVEQPPADWGKKSKSYGPGTLSIGDVALVKVADIKITADTSAYSYALEKAKEQLAKAGKKVLSTASIQQTMNEGFMSGASIQKAKNTTFGNEPEPKEDNDSPDNELAIYVNSADEIGGGLVASGVYGWKGPIPLVLASVLSYGSACKIKLCNENGNVKASGMFHIDGLKPAYIPSLVFKIFFKAQNDNIKYVGKWDFSNPEKMLKALYTFWHEARLEILKELEDLPAHAPKLEIDYDIKSLMWKFVILYKGSACHQSISDMALNNLYLPANKSPNHAFFNMIFEKAVLPSYGLSDTAETLMELFTKSLWQKFS